MTYAAPRIGLGNAIFFVLLGQIVLGGSFTAPVFARAGDSFHADYGPLGAISVRFT